jgi:hypothetical protein
MKGQEQALLAALDAAQHGLSSGERRLSVAARPSRVAEFRALVEHPVEKIHVMRLDFNGAPHWKPTDLPGAAGRISST